MSQITFIKISAVVTRAAISPATIYKLISMGLFPKPIKTIGDRVAWVEAHIDHYNQMIVDGSTREQIKAWVASVNPPKRQVRKETPVPIARIRVRSRA